jgi:hypothetical protein
VFVAAAAVPEVPNAKASKSACEPSPPIFSATAFFPTVVITSANLITQ